MPAKLLRKGTGRPLSESITTRPLIARSANLERDVLVPLDHYLPTACALDGVRRWARSMVAHSATRAWSITGPYGSGKSSFALLLSGLAAPREDPARQRADELVHAVDPDLGELLTHARDVIGASDRGLVRVLATAATESVSTTGVIRLGGELGVIGRGLARCSRNVRAPQTRRWPRLVTDTRRGWPARPVAHSPRGLDPGLPSQPIGDPSPARSVSVVPLTDARDRRQRCLERTPQG